MISLETAIFLLIAFIIIGLLLSLVSALLRATMSLIGVVLRALVLAAALFGAYVYYYGMPF